MSIIYEANVFHGGAVELGHAAWLRNSFQRCRLIISALPTDWSGNNIAECQLEFPSRDLTPAQFADWVTAKDPGLAAALREWIARNCSAGKPLH